MIKSSFIANGQHCIKLARSVYDSLAKDGGIQAVMDDIQRRREKNSAARLKNTGSTKAPELRIIIVDSKAA